MEQSTTGLLAGIAAPFFMALGFIIWDVTWKKFGGSAFALNLFKCNLASLGFLIIVFILGWETTTTPPSNENENNRDMNDNENVFTLQSILFLILSGFIGIIIGDLAWLEALRLLGATKVLIIDSIKPFSAAIMGWLFLGETISNPIAYSGIILTVLGIFVVSLEKERLQEQQQKQKQEKQQQQGSYDDLASAAHETHTNDLAVLNNLDDSSTNVHNNDVNECNDIINEEGAVRIEKNVDVDDNITIDEHGSWWNFRGYILAVLNVLLDTYGSLLTKQHGGGMSTWAINLIRFGSAGIIMITISIASHLIMTFKQDTKLINTRVGKEKQTPWYSLPSMNVKAWMKICIGVLFVTFICPALSNYALFQITLVLALTVGSISPLYALVLEWPFHGNKPTIQATCGALLAVGGVVILGIWQK